MPKNMYSVEFTEVVKRRVKVYIWAEDPDTALKAAEDHGGEQYADETLEDYIVSATSIKEISHKKLVG